MNRNIGMVVTFIAGVVVGAAATYKIAEQKYSNIANEEIESVIERFSNRKPMEIPVKGQPNKKPDNKSDELVEALTTSKRSVEEYKQAIKNVGYDKISTENSKPKKSKKKDDVEEKEEATMSRSNIYIISPDEYNTVDGFETETLYYSSDNYVLDSDYQVLSDSEIRNKIDHDPFGHFGEYEEDSVYVRNEDLMCDYEILLSMKTCAEIRED